MDSDYKKIKEISMISHYVLDGNSDYDDLLRISRHWVSYKRNRIKDGKEIVNWSYKTSSDVLYEKYKQVCECLINEFNYPHKAYIGNSQFKFNIRITYDDGSHEDLSKNGTFMDNEMSENASNFIRLVPESEQFPEVLTLSSIHLRKASKNEDPVLMIYEALAVLHKRGYEKLRIMSEYSPSGCYFRCNISIAENFDKTTGFVCQMDMSFPIFRYSTGAEFDILGDKVLYDDKTVDELADAILLKYPEFKTQGKGTDKTYILWYEKVLDLCRDGKYPYAFDDSGYNIFAAGKIRLTNGEWIEYAPPGSYE